MPPQRISADQSCITKFPATCQHDYAILSKWFLLVFVVVVGLRLAVVKYSSRKNWTPDSETVANVAERCPIACQRPSHKDTRQNASTVRQYHQAMVFKPMYPWTAPPQSLPGPYDPRFYPPPSIRRQTYNSAVEEPKDIPKTAYIRRVSLNSMPTQQSTLRGTVIVSSKGWRRNQWIISGE
jgi:hypothetical protein